MSSLNMNGPYDFNNDSVDANVTQITGGNYALGVVDRITGNFHVAYVGRSDSDIKGRLKLHLSQTENTFSRYKTKNTSFKYCYASSPKEAFEKECHNYHDFIKSIKLFNKTHPEKPEGLNWNCPVCGT